MTEKTAQPGRRFFWLRRIAFGLLALVIIAAIPFGIAYRSVTIVAAPYSIASAALAMDRRIIVYPPPGYDSGVASRYPIIYALDGQGFRHGALTAIWVRVLSAAGLTEPMIVVAVDNMGTRDIDMRPPHPIPAHDDPPIAGRDAAFSAFFRDELIPFIDQHYRTSAYRIISGHSLGGLYAVDRLSRSPGLFQAHFAYSPSFTHDSASLPRLRAAMAMRRAEPALLYMNIGEEGGVNYLAFYQRAAAIIAARPQPSEVFSQVERHRLMVHPIVMIPGQARALIWWSGRVNRCALTAPSDSARIACYTAR